MRSHVRRLFSRLFTGMCFLSFVTTAAAQEEKPAPPLQVEEVVVTATRTEVPLNQLGSSVTVITERDIQERQATEVAELLKTVPGLIINQTGSHGGLTSLFSRGGESDFNLILIDGVQVNEQGGGFDLSGFTTTNIERVEIIQGAQSALYGSDAMTAVVNIITKRGRGKPLTTFLTQWGWHTESGALISQQRVGLSGGETTYNYSFGYDRVDDQGILEFNNDFYNNVFSGSVQLFPGERLKLSLSTRYDTAKFEFPTENTGDRFDRANPGLDPRQFERRDNLTLGLKAAIHHFSWWDSQLLLGLNNRSSVNRDEPDPAFTLFDGTTVSVFSPKQRRVMADYLWNFTLGEPKKFLSTTTVGVEFEREDFDQSSFNEHRDNKGYYFQEQLGLFGRFFVTGGVRIEENSKFGTDVNPKGTMAALIQETGTKIRGAIGTGIKEPAFSENFDTTFSKGNPDLDPEQSFSWEAGLDQGFLNERHQITFTYFENKFKDLVTSIPLTPPIGSQTSTFANIRRARSRGVEAGVTTHPYPDLTLSAFYTYLETEVTDDGGISSVNFQKGLQLLRRPRHSGSLLVNARLGRLNLNLNGTYVGKRDDVRFLTGPPFATRVVNDDYFLLNATALLDLVKEPGVQWSFVAKLNNVLNENYEDAFGFSSPRFNFLIGARLQF